MNAREQAEALLNPGETLEEISFCQPRTMYGTILAASGVAMAVDTAPYALKNPGLTAYVVLGAALAWAGVWLLNLCRNSWVAVTSQRVLVQRVNALGRPGRRQEYPLQEVEGSRLCKPTVSFKSKSNSGTVLIALKSGQSRQLPYLENGQFIHEAISEALHR